MLAHAGPYDPSVHGELLVYSPSNDDHFRSAAINSANLASATERYEELKRRIDILGDDAPSKAINSLTRMQATAEMYERRISEGHAADRRIGNLFASSGYAVSERHLCQLDWALINLDEDRIGTNLVRRNYFENRRRGSYRTNVMCRVSNLMRQ